MSTEQFPEPMVSLGKEPMFSGLEGVEGEITMTGSFSLLE